MRPRRIDAFFVCGGRYHDFDYARLEILKALGAHERIRVHVAGDYRDLAALGGADFLITYTCDLRPDEAAQDGLAAFVERGGRWFALHGTNSIIEWTAEGKVATPRSLPRLMQLLGSQFIAHPPIMEFDVEVSDPAHPLVAGLERFRIRDELYLSEMHGANHVLLHCHYSGKAQQGFVEEDWHSDEARPVMYLHAHGEGEVLYLTPGHCRGHYDMQPLMQYYPDVERCAWESPAYHELLRRGIRWAARLDEAG